MSQSRSTLTEPSGHSFDDVPFDVLFHALGNDDRLAILDRLRRCGGAPATIEQIARHVEISRFATSRHLAILRAAGLVQGQRIGHKYLHLIRSEPFERLDGWLTDYLSL